MIRYAARAVPWFRVALAAALVIVLMEFVRWSPWVLWPLEGTAVGLLAGASAWCCDEQAAAVVDVAPRGLAWRTVARAPAVTLLAATWAAVVWGAHPSLFGHWLAVLGQGLAAVVAGAAWAVWRRAAGDPMPGLGLSVVVVPAATAWALVRPFERRLPVFPYGLGGRYGNWHDSSAGWLALGAVAVLVLALALGDAHWWRSAVNR